MWPFRWLVLIRELTVTTTTAFTDDRVAAVWPEQRPFSLPPNQATRGHPAHPPRVNYTALLNDHTPLSEYLLRFETLDEKFHHGSDSSPPMKGMELVKLHDSGESKERVNLMFMADGCTYIHILY